MKVVCFIFCLLTFVNSADGQILKQDTAFVIRMQNVKKAYPKIYIISILYIICFPYNSGSSKKIEKFLIRNKNVKHKLTSKLNFFGVCYPILEPTGSFTVTNSSGTTVKYKFPDKKMADTINKYASGDGVMTERIDNFFTLSENSYISFDKIYVKGVLGELQQYSDYAGFYGQEENLMNWERKFTVFKNGEETQEVMENVKVIQTYNNFLKRRHNFPYFYFISCKYLKSYKRRVFAP